ncbi:MAG: sialidase family protein [Solirubrobacterales bacterium]
MRKGHPSTRPLLLLTTLGALLALALIAALAPRSASEAQAAPPDRVRDCAPPKDAMTFAPQTYVDTERAGGEPTVEMHPDGTLLYGSHAGTTHFFAPAAADEDTAAFAQHYRNQTYLYWSDDAGATWNYVDRLPPDNAPGSGFSDPDWAIDAAGNVYESEINLVNVAMSKSTDSGRSYTLQNFFAQTITDRQWSEADLEDHVYLVGNAFAGGTFPTDPVGHVGHTLYKSVDGGQTFSAGEPDPGGLGDLQVDKSTGTLYEANLSGGTLAMAAFRSARDGNFSEADRELNTIATGVDMEITSHWPSLDVDPSGNVYITWSEDGGGDREAGVYYSSSTDEGRTWAEPTLVDPGSDGTDIWPWLAVGDDGRVAVSWLEADVVLPNHDAQTPGDHGWRIIAAQTLDGTGCGKSSTPGFSSTVATPDPVHPGTICTGGTICQAQGVDRRLGDYFSIEIDNDGRMWAGYSDTRQGGAVALPGFVRQDGGPSFLGKGGKPAGKGKRR